MSILNNLAITAVNGTITHAIGGAVSTLQTLIANGGRDRNCKFYYNNGAGGSVLQVVAKGVVGGVVSELKDEAVNAFNSLLNGKKKTEATGQKWIESELKKQDEEKKNYGKMRLDEGTVYALDDWGCISPDALMLGIDTDQEITITQTYPSYRVDAINGKNGGTITNTVRTKTLVWYDTTALITINSDKNMVITRVAGRDYSRKELVSNGDIRFSVSGQITSSRPNTYPTEEVKKFIKCMQYKGIIQINNQILDQFGITHIVIENFNLQPREGYKAVQSYSFSAIGLQPENEIQITEDTVTITHETSETIKNDGSEWMKMLNNQLEGLKSIASDLFDQGTGLAAGMLNNLL